jgi:NTE family protein
MATSRPHETWQWPEPKMAGDITAVPTSRPIFAIFEGGGAKGIAHVGAYAAAVDIDLEFVGVAGASAGSIVATLIAVGFAPGDIFDPATPHRDIFTDNAVTPIDLLGRRQWRLLQRLLRYGMPALGCEALLCLVAFAASLLGSTTAARASAGLAIVFAVALALLGWPMLRRRGILDPRQFAAGFNQILHRRVAKVYREAGRDVSTLPERIRFRDIDPRQSQNFCRLKVVVTDLTGQQLRLFDHRTPDAVVADVVAASIAIPGIFAPASIAAPTPAAQRLYADGGLVSNLPVWCFAEEKAAIERTTPHNAAVPVVAFTLTDTPGDGMRALLSPLRYFGRVLMTGIFGGQTVVQEFVSDLYTVALSCNLKLLAFDTTRAQAAEAFRICYKQAYECLRRRLIVEPDTWQTVLKNVSGEVRLILSARRSATAAELQLRASVFEPLRSLEGLAQAATSLVTAFHVTHSYNMEEDADDRLTIDAACPGVPEAWQQQSITLLAPSQDGGRRAVMSKYERALVRRSMTSAVCVPIFSDSGMWEREPALRATPLAVVSFDSDEDITPGLLSDDMMLKSVAEATFGLSALLQRGVLE